MAEIQGQVLDVQGRQTSKGSTVYDIKFSDGKTYATFKEPLANAAKSAVGRTVVADVSIESKNGYTNYNWWGVKSSTQTQAGDPIVVQTPAIPIVPAPQPGSMPLEREQKIVKQSSFATAFNFVAQFYAGAGPDEIPQATDTARRIARSLYEAVMGSESVTERPQQTGQEEALMDALKTELDAREVAPGSSEPW